MDLRVTYIQYQIVWENIKENLSLLDKKLSNIDETDLIILPEMFVTGFTMNPIYDNELVITWMKNKSVELNCAITGSFIVKENGSYYNRLHFVKSSGDVEVYDKRHLFGFAGEDEVYTPGDERIIVDYLGWKICPLICYDLRFPVWSRNTENYDILIYVANWPNSRIDTWKTLLKARSIENQCYTIGVNTIGSNNGVEYSGYSSIHNPGGDTMYEIYDYSIVQTTLYKEELRYHREKFPFLDDLDEFEIT